MTSTPKPQVEVQQETSERLEVLELDRTPRPEKLARETAVLEGASEVAFHERAFRPRHPADVGYIRERVDALEIRRRELPDVPAPPELPPAPPPAPKPIPERLRAPLASVVPGPLVAVEPVFESDGGEVVEAYWDENGERRSRHYLVKDDAATPVEDVSKMVDALPAPKVAPPAPEPAKDATKEEPKKRKLTLPFGKKKSAEAGEEPAKQDAEKTPRFGFRKRGGS